MEPTNWPLRVYYDRSCPLCAEEMHALVAYDQHQRIELADCSAHEFADPAPGEAGISVKEMMTIIHARDASGRWYRGVDVFVLAYAAVDMDAMARLWSHPWLRPLWDAAYPWFARNRQWLSRLGSARIYGWILRRAAAKSARRSAACGAGACELP